MTSRDIDDVSRFLKEIGARIKAVRQAKGVSRRWLSDSSGVSQRYLAELENGGVNVSIALLLNISVALDTPLAQLVSQENSQVKPSNVHKSIALIGLRGAGKSTLGARASRVLEIPFVELNDVISSAGNMPVHEVFDLYGAEGYRRLERQALERMSDNRAAGILAVGGGIVSNAQTFSYLLNCFHTIWIKAEPEEHMARVIGQGDERPMEGHPQAMNDLREILGARAGDYARADAIVDTSGKDIDSSFKTLLSVINSNGFLVETPSSDA